MFDKVLSRPLCEKLLNGFENHSLQWFIKETVWVNYAFNNFVF